jgi:hypothetical protein
VATPTRDYRLTGHRSQVIHRADCRVLARAERSAGWPFGDGKTPEQISVDLGSTTDSLRFCQVCCPGAQIQEWQEPRCAKPGCGLPYSDPIHILDHHPYPDDLRGR